MHKIIAVIFSLCFTGAYFGALAQTDSAPSAPPSKASGVMSKVSSQINIYTSQWLDAPPGITVKPVSLGYSVYVQYKQPLWDPYITFLIGAGIGYTDFRNNGGLYYSEDLDSTYFRRLQPNEYVKNKMTLVTVDAPVEFRFQLKPKKKSAPFIAPGFLAGALINDYTKRTGEDHRGNRTKQKIYYTRNLNGYHFGPTLRLGYGSIGLYGYYALTPLFEEGRGPETTYWKAGISFGGN